MKIETLKNGIRVVVVPLRGLRSVTLEAVVKIGAKYESKEEQGMSHFLEHLAFKGTTKRPGASDVHREMDERGVNYNAETGYETVAYHVTTVRDNLSWATEIMGDMLFNSTMPEDEVLKERGVIIEEIKMYHDNPIMGMGAEMAKFLYGESPVGCWDVAGEVTDIEKIDREAIVAFRNKFWNTKEMVIVVAGDVKEADLELIRDNFEQYQVEGEKLPEVVVRLTNERERIIKREVEQGHFAMALPAFGWSDPRRYALRLLNIIMAGNASCRLSEEIRNKRGWAYYVIPIGETLKEVGFWGVQVGVSQKKLTEAIEVTEREVLGMSKTITEEELKRAKTYLRGKVGLSLDESDFWSGYIAEKLLLEGELRDPEEELKKTEMVTIEEMKALIDDTFVADKVRKLITTR